jgi:hypothetical protein
VLKSIQGPVREDFSRAKAQRKPLETRQRFAPFAPLREKSSPHKTFVQTPITPQSTDEIGLAQ